MLFKKDVNLRIKKRFLSVIKKQNVGRDLKYTTLLKTYLFLVPNNWSCYILKGNYSNNYVIQLYTNIYYYQFSIPSVLTTLYFDSESKVIYFSNYKAHNTFNLWLKEMYQILYYFNSFLFFKIKFKGKGYYIYKNKRNTITPQFGYSHRIYIYSYFNLVKFLTKTKILVFGFSKKDILYVSNKLKAKRSINIFTGRGVRFSKQIVYKKTGKVSAYR